MLSTEEDLKRFAGATDKCTEIAKTNALPLEITFIQKNLLLTKNLLLKTYYLQILYLSTSVAVLLPQTAYSS